MGCDGMSFSFTTNNKDIEHLLDRLTKYPVVKADSKLCQTFSRCKKIRYLSSKENIYIRKGLVALPPQVHIERNGNKFIIRFD